MSTKINVRSPFYIEFTEPVQALGTFTCTTASLQNFAVSSDGTVTVPTIARGTIIDQTATSFAQNTSGSAISRSVTYTIEIPQNFSNTADGTIDCTVTADQPSQSTQEDPVQNNNCPTFSGTMPSHTNVGSGTTVDLSTYFTAGSGAAISGYEVITYGAQGISHSISGSTLTLSSSVDCAETTFVIVAKNANDSCTAVSNSFVASSNCVDDQNNPINYDCTILNLQGGGVQQDGQHNKSTFDISGSVKELIYDGSVLPPPYNVGANTTGSDRNITITYRVYIPQGYANYSAGATIDCDKTYTQPAAQTLIDFDCAEAGLANLFISKKGNVAEPTIARGTIESWTPQSFDEVSTDTLRTVTFTITAPYGFNYSNEGQEIPCPKQIWQPETIDDCGNTVLYLTSQGFSSPTGFCGSVYSARVSAFSNASSFADIRSTLGQRICVSGNLFRGGLRYYGYAQTRVSSAAGDIGASYYVLQIDDFGIVRNVAIANCSGGGTSGDL